jgi:hypothetical protein
MGVTASSLPRFQEEQCQYGTLTIGPTFYRLIVNDGEEAAICILLGNEGHLTNMIEHVSLLQKYLPFLPFDRRFPHSGQSTILFPAER